MGGKVSQKSETPPPEKVFMNTSQTYGILCEYVRSVILNIKIPVVLLSSMNTFSGGWKVQPKNLASFYYVGGNRIK